MVQPAIDPSKRQEPSVTVARGLRLDVKRALAVGVVGLAGALGVLVLVLQLAGSSDAIDVQLGDPDFRGIHAAALAAEIADHGPIPFPDLVGNDLPIWVAHHGADPSLGWVVVSARVPDSADCLVQWDGATGRFVDGCDAGYRLASRRDRTGSRALDGGRR